MGPAYQTLQKYFGYTSFLPLQEEIIKDILCKNDVFVLMPTGGGKSLCYQLPSLILDGVTLVVSPLIALMKDQVDSLKANGIAATYINSSLSSNEIQTIKSELLEDRISILYVAPERIIQPDFLQFLQRLSINLIAVDEAHCISEWGHDFRPSYRQLKSLREYFFDTPLIAMTATAVPEVQNDILTQLKLNNPKIYRASLNRENLSYLVKPKRNAYSQLLQYLADHQNESGIIYRYSRKSADDLANKLQEDGYRVLPYHAGLNSDLRAETQNKFVEDEVEIIVATIAFGMGIDKSNIRFVIHYDLPKNLETYYQETGRAGRDGEKSDCILFFSHGDKFKIEHFIRQKDDETDKQLAYKKLRDMINFGGSTTCRRKILLNYFGEAYDETNCGNCDVCLQPKEKIDGTIIAQKIVSCMSQVNERFGINYIADILCGSRTQKINSKGHDTLTSYGTGKEYSKKQWQAFIRELIQLDYLKLEGDRYPIVKVTQKIRDILAENEMILLTMQIEEIAATQKNSEDNFDHDLFGILRGLRWELASEEGVSPFIIFHDSTLKEMARSFPQSLSDFHRIKGVGEGKLEKYGELFLETIVDYCNKHGHTRHFPVEEKAYSVEEIRKTHLHAYEPWTNEDDEKLIAGYEAGKTIDELMELFGRRRGGIVSRLKKSGMFLPSDKETSNIKRLIITDLSRMGGNRVCIFGIDENKQHIRPVLPYSMVNERYLFDKSGKLIIKPFAEIEFGFLHLKPSPPHTEDFEIDTNYEPKLIRNLSENESKMFLEKILDEFVKEIFGATIHGNRYICPEEGERSLGTVKAMEILSVNYSMEESGKYKYRITFSDMSGEIYDLPVTDCAFRKYCDAQRIQVGKDMDSISDELQQRLNDSDVYLRVGLTRVFEDKHWLQISGVHVFSDHQKANLQVVDNAKKIVTRGNAEKLILDLLRSAGGGMNVDVLKTRVLEQGLDSNFFERIIADYRKSGEVYSPTLGYIKIV
jgi:ATP-dependent DNA helicase RecQ